MLNTTMQFDEIVNVILEKNAKKVKRKKSKAKEENVEQYDHAIAVEHVHKQKRST
jgi:hypothetical protein